MRNRGLVVFLTTIISALCIYYLSFTWASFKIQKAAIAHATDESGQTDFSKKQAYLDSVWKKPVHRLLGWEHTYEDVKERELTLGLDLQGGMHVTLEVSPVELIQGLSGGNKNAAFLAALKQAQQNQARHPQTPFTTLFYQAYQRQKNAEKLSSIFATAANRHRISHNSSDKAILKLLNQEIDRAIDRSFEIIRSRIDRFGTSQPNIQRLQGTGRIQIELPGVNNPERVRKLLQGVAQLRFWEVYEIPELSDSLQAIDKLWVSKKPTRSINNKKERNEERSSPLFSLLKGSYGLSYAVEDVKTIKELLARKDVKALLPNDLQWFWDVKPQKLQDGTSVMTLHAIKQRLGRQAALEGDVITDARQEFDDRGRAVVSMQMNSLGARAWKRVTANNINRRIAITLDNHVYSAPVVNTEIPNGNSQITGNFTVEEAQDLANILKAGSLPAPVKIVEEAIIGPTLGQKAQMQGIYSMALGLALVVLFMIFYYARGGIVANVALLFNILFILGVLAQLNAALTLPGIAGIVLTIGMSIDANVLIFERIREELREGAQISAAINQGYQKAYSSIIDSNVTTFLTGAILYFIGQGPVRGFATTLMIGIISSFFTAVFITRIIMDWFVRRRWEKYLTFSYSYSRDVLNGLNIDFLKLRYLSYGFSLAIILTGFGLMAQQGGLNLGVDFTGGRSYVVAFGKPMEPSTLKTRLAEHLGDQGTEIKTYGSNSILKITTSYLIEEESTKSDELVRSALVKGIKQSTGLEYVADNTRAINEQCFAIASTAKVGATIAGDIKNSAQQSIFLSLIMIFLYILVRFQKWQFGLAAVIALFHDTLIVLASYAIAKALGYTFEVDQVFIAALLTIIGYSINDTVVVFDRVRELMAHKTDFSQITNKAINETMSRTLITSFTTLIAVAILLAFGGEVLRGFSFSLLIGVIFGTYSSIFIAMPLVTDLTRQRPKTARKGK